MKIVFMGTPDFAVPCLRTLAESGHELAAVFTQPDKPKGRGYKLIPTPVKAAALEYDIPVYQPLSLRTPAPESLYRPSLSFASRGATTSPCSHSQTVSPAPPPVRMSPT
mgnify:CR=1 FL=1